LGIDFTLPPGGTITGIVSRVIGGFEMECNVIAYSPDWIEQPIHTAKTDEFGVYAAYGLPSGDYYLRAKSLWGSGSARRYYPDSYEKEGAELVHVDSGNLLSDIDFLLPEGNFALDLTLDMPRTMYAPGDEFYLNLVFYKSGPDLEGLPVFVLLETFGTYYFWPSWRRYSPPESPYIDYRLENIPSGTSTLEIFPSFPWPDTGTSGTDLLFMGAVMNWSLSGLAGNIDIVEWGFE